MELEKLIKTSDMIDRHRMPSGNTKSLEQYSKIQLFILWLWKLNTALASARGVLHLPILSMNPRLQFSFFMCILCFHMLISPESIDVMMQVYGTSCRFKPCSHILGNKGKYFKFHKTLPRLQTKVCATDSSLKSTNWSGAGDVHTQTLQILPTIHFHWHVPCSLAPFLRASIFHSHGFYQKYEVSDVMKGNVLPWPIVLSTYIFVL